MSIYRSGNALARASITNADSPYTANRNTRIFADSSGGAITINLPAAATWQAGDEVEVIDSGGAAATNNITLDASGAETINGSLTFVLNTNRAAVSLASNGTALFVGA